MSRHKSSTDEVTRKFNLLSMTVRNKIRAERPLSSKAEKAVFELFELRKKADALRHDIIKEYCH